MTPPFQDSAFDETATGVAGPYDGIRRVLAEVPRPRRVRFSRKGKSSGVLVIAVLFASVGIFFAVLAARPSASNPGSGSPQVVLPFALPVLFLLVMVALLLRTITRQKALLVEGELAMGRVTERRWARHGPTIRYEFTTPLGEHFSRGASDGTGRLDVGMGVAIFYDPRSPKKQVALCGSFYEVVMPEKE